MFSALNHESLADFLDNHWLFIAYWGFVLPTYFGYFADKIRGD